MKPQALGWFVGQVMRSSGGKANPQAVNDLLRTKLRSLDDRARGVASHSASPPSHLLSFE